MTEEELIKCLKKLRRDSRQRYGLAPHKPLLLLLVLKLYKEELIDIPFAVIDRDLTGLLREFCISEAAEKSPEVPFWHLRNDCAGKLWEVEIPKKVRFARRPDGKRGRPLIADLRKYGGQGRLKAEVITLLRKNKHLCDRLITVILDTYFDESQHSRILEMLRINKSRADADAQAIEFRKSVFFAYDSRCAICEFSVSMGNALIGLDAAHIKWKTLDGPDLVTNGIALCANHHRLFNRGAFSLKGPEENYSVLIAKNVNFSDELAKSRQNILRFNLPLHRKDNPEPEFLEWHRDVVFERNTTNLLFQ